MKNKYLLSEVCRQRAYRAPRTRGLPTRAGRSRPDEEWGRENIILQVLLGTYSISLVDTVLHI